jgi:hypothetical protein
MNDKDKKKNRVKVSFRRLLYLTVLLACVGWLIYAHVRGLNAEPVNTFIPVSLHASTTVDYKDGARDAWWFSMEEGLLKEAFINPDPGSSGIAPQLTEMDSSLAVPVPTVTPVSLWSGLGE